MALTAVAENKRLSGTFSDNILLRISHIIVAYEMERVFLPIAEIIWELQKLLAELKRAEILTYIREIAENKTDKYHFTVVFSVTWP